MLDNPTLILLGESSYSLYLLHVPTIKRALVVMWLGWPVHGLVNIGFILVSVLVSMIGYKSIEIPGRVFIRSRLTTRERESKEKGDLSEEVPESVSSE